MMPASRSHRALIMGRNGAVGANHPLATQAGLDMLRAGGNAFDAAVAISLALGVVEPMMSGLGGDGFYHVHVAASGAALVYNGTGPPRRPPPPKPSPTASRSTAPAASRCPASLAGLGAMHAAHGSLPWARSRRPPPLARPRRLRRHPRLPAFRHRQPPPTRSRPTQPCSFLPDGATGTGDIVTQPNLAATLEEIAARGAEAFYRGPLAARLARGPVRGRHD